MQDAIRAAMNWWKVQVGAVIRREEDLPRLLTKEGWEILERFLGIEDRVQRSTKARRIEGISDAGSSSLGDGEITPGMNIKEMLDELRHLCPDMLPFQAFVFMMVLFPRTIGDDFCRHATDGSKDGMPPEGTKVLLRTARSVHCKNLQGIRATKSHTHGCAKGGSKRQSGTN